MFHKLSFRRRLFLSIIVSMLTSLAFITPIHIPSWQKAYDIAQSNNRIFIAIAKLMIVMEDKGLLAFILVVFFTVYYIHTLFAVSEQENKDNNLKMQISSVVFSLMLSICMITGASIQAFESLDFLLANKFQSVFSFILFVGYWLFFYTGIEAILAFLNHSLAIKKSETKPISCSSPLLLLERFPFSIPFVFCLVCWLPYWIIHFPGSVPFDGFRQLNYYFGIEQWRDHHPVLGSLLYGSLIKLGRIISGDNMGVAIISLLHHLLFAFTFAYSHVVMKRWLITRVQRIGVLLFLTIHPMIAYWPQTLLKDTLASILILLFCILYLDLIRLMFRNLPFTQKFIITVFVGIVASLIRHNAIYITVISLLMLFFIKQSTWKRLIPIVGSISCCIFTIIISSALISAVNAIPASISGVLSIPFQQTARYLLEHGDEVTSKERDAINNVLNYDLLAERYDPDLSDAVKSLYKGNNEFLPEYFKTWFSMFLKHPVTYLEATLSNSYSYYYPNGDSTPQTTINNFITTHKEINTGYFHMYQIVPSSIRQVMLNIFNFMKKTPGLSVFFYLGFYTWFTLFLMLFLFQKKKYVFLLGFTPTLLNILTCIASPVNGHLRYYLPSLMMVPLLLVWTLYNGLREESFAKFNSQIDEPQNDTSL